MQKQINRQFFVKKTGIFICKKDGQNHKKALDRLLRGYRLFGMEKEPPNDLINIFYRCVRYSIFFQRKKSLIPSLKYFVNLVRDELKIKYGGIRFQRYAGCPVPNRGSSYPLDEKGNGVDKTIPERIPT